MTPGEINALAEAVADRLADKLAAKLADFRQEAATVMDRKEAARYVRKGAHGFYAWSKAWKVQACAWGRYSRRALDAGMEREARGKREGRKAA